ncbi:MAG: hypothetical protein KJO98_03490, partial [Rhodothermia bacterium]|nr:hypothetical protein [Rhodothermia bacterium]
HDYLRRPSRLKNLLKPLIPEDVRTRMVARLRNANMAPAPRLSTQDRLRLTAEFENEITSLQQMLDVDLDVWLK